MRSMRQRNSKLKLLLAALGVLVCSGLVTAVNASAAYRQVGNFSGTPGELQPGAAEHWPEQVQLGGAAGLAVNYTGAGGVPAGTLYAATENFVGSANQFVVRFSPDGEFRERWRIVTNAEESAAIMAGKPPYERCGPEGESVEHGGPVVPCEATALGGAATSGIAVDQTTGDVYTYFTPFSYSDPDRTVITVYNPTGSEVIARFGGVAGPTESIAESPGEIHQNDLLQPLAVNSAGEVYVFDADSSFHHRLMVFKPTNPGVYSEYEYAGQSSDIGAGAFGVTNYPARPVVDAAGFIYVSNGEHIEKYDPTHPGQPAICSFFYRKGAISTIAVNPLTDEVFFGLENEPTIHTLGPCVDGKMFETGTVAFSPNRLGLSALALDPVRSFEPGLTPGILFAASPSDEGGQVKGKHPNVETESAIGFVFAPASEVGPEVLNERVSNVTSVSARLEGEVNPRANPSRYAFQYISDAAFQANEPYEKQAISITASGGVFGISANGRGVGGMMKGTLSVGSKELTNPIGAEGTVDVTEGSKKLENVVTTFGQFEVGDALVGPGLVRKPIVQAVEGSTIVMNEPASETVSGSTVAGNGVGRLASGLAIEGPGIPAGTTVTQMGPESAVLSAAATSSGVAVVHAGLPVDASAGRLRRALERLPAIGPRNVSVTGGLGDAAGSSPYVVTFVGGLSGVNVDELGVDTSALSGTGNVTTLHEGGGGFVGAVEAPAGGAAISGAKAVPVAASIGGLQPNTAYRFRIVARSFCLPKQPTQECLGVGNGKTFKAYSSDQSGLPDGRGYEMVSPPEKEGGQVLPLLPTQSSCVAECKPGNASIVFPRQSGPDGESVVYEGEPFSATGALIENEYLSRRTATGWQTSSLAPSTLEDRGGAPQVSGGYKAFDPALTKGVLLQGPSALAAGGLEAFRDLYTQPTATPSSFAPLLTGTNATPRCNPGTTLNTSLELSYMGASEDLSKVFFEANDALTPESTGVCGQGNLYEWSAGSLKAVNVLPGATSSTPGAVIGSGELAGGGIPTTSGTAVQAVSADGSRVAFTGADGHLYVRMNGSTTVEVPGASDCDKANLPIERQCFIASSPDLGRLLLSNGQMYGLNQAGSGYEPTVNLMQGRSGFVGIAGQSRDLTDVYFVSTSVLTGEEENDQGAIAEEGQYNLYGWIAGSTHFIGALLEADGQGGSSSGSTWSPTSIARSAEASPDGRFLAFQSQAQLAEADPAQTCPFISGGEVQEGPCTRIYLYDSATQMLICASCSRSGAKPKGSSYLAISPTLSSAGYLRQPYYLTDSGRLVFNSADQLAPGDSNGGVEDVYEYEQAGLGSCQEAKGCVSLLSSGSGEADSNFIAMDPDGENVFFVTRDRLARADRDGLLDLYDARVGGGFAEISTPGECKGEGCQPATSVPPQPTPSSDGVQPETTDKGGVKCKKGKVKRGGKCVKKPKKKNQKHKKKHKKHMKKRQGGGAGKKFKSSQSSRGKEGNR